nr:hypothetical protein [Tanacetum cinerariifolium]
RRAAKEHRIGHGRIDDLDLDTSGTNYKMCSAPSSTVQDFDSSECGHSALQRSPVWQKNEDLVVRVSKDLGAVHVEYIKHRVG